MYVQYNSRREAMILWVNGAYGISGRPASAMSCKNRLPVSHLFDPEAIGDVIRNVLPPSLWKDDFQDYLLAQGHGLPIVGGMICLS